MEEAGVPKGVFNVLLGKGSMGDHIVHHPDVRVVGFTGSTNIGCQIGEVCGRLNKRCSLEMGGKNAQIVMEDANLELALEGVLWELSVQRDNAVRLHHASSYTKIFMINS